MDASGEFCFDAPPEETDLFLGAETLYNSSDDLVEITGVTLIEPRGVRLVEAFVLPEPYRREWDSLGVWASGGRSLPPGQLHAIPGATVHPTASAARSVDEPALVLRFVTDRDAASFDAVTITYTRDEGGESRVSRPSNFSFTVPCSSS